ncbi:MAG: hypothetical protein AAGA65_09075 [Actinomycetota bacterium]
MATTKPKNEETGDQAAAGQPDTDTAETADTASTGARHTEHNWKPIVDKAGKPTLIHNDNGTHHNVKCTITGATAYRG